MKNIASVLRSSLVYFGISIFLAFLLVFSLFPHEIFARNLNPGSGKLDYIPQFDTSIDVVTFRFLDQAGLLSGTGEEMVYVDGIGYKSNGDQINVSDQSTISFRAYYKQGSGLYGPKITQEITGDYTIDVEFFTLTTNFQNQYGFLDPANGIGTGDERVYIDNVGYKADNEAIVVPLNSTIAYTAYFKEGSGLYGNKTSTLIDGSFDNIDVNFHSLALDFVDQNGELNSASGIGTGAERVYIDNIGYKANFDSIVVPLQSTIRCTAYYKEGSGLYGNKVSILIDGSFNSVSITFQSLAINLRDQSSDLDPANGLGTGEERVYIDNVGYKADNDNIVVPLNSNIKYTAYFKQGSGLYGDKANVQVNVNSDLLDVEFWTLRIQFKDQNGNLDPANGIGTGDERVYIDNVGYKANNNTVSVPLNCNLKYTAYYKQGSGLYGNKTSILVDGSFLELDVMFHSLTLNFKDQYGDLDSVAGIGTGLEMVYIDNVGYKADDNQVVVPLNSTVRYTAYFKQGSGLYGDKKTAIINGTFNILIVDFQRIKFNIIDSQTQLLVIGAQVYIDNVGYINNGNYIEVPINSTLHHKAKIGNIWSISNLKLVNCTWTNCIYAWNGTGFLDPVYENPQVIYNVIMESASGGTLTSPGIGSFSYPDGTTVEIIAAPDMGYSFAGWSGDYIGSENPAYILVDGNKSITAHFLPAQYSIITAAGEHGSISPSGIITIDSGDNQSFAITPEVGYSIVDVLVDNLSIGAVTSYTFTKVATDHTIVASFALTEYSLTVNVNGNGIVNRNNNGPYHFGDLVQLTAISDNGWNFDGWSGDLSGVNNPETLIIDNNETVTAFFKQSSLIAFWNFNEGTGDIVIDVGGTHSGIVHGANWVTDDNLGYALQFDGMDDFVDFGDNESWDFTANPFTLEFWVKSSFDQSGTILSNLSANGEGFSLVYDAENDLLRFSSNGNSVSFPWADSLNSWNSFVLTGDGSKYYLYINGDRVGNAQNSFTILPSSSPMTCGGSSITGIYFQGVMDDISLFKLAKTAGEIKSDFLDALPRSSIEVIVLPDSSTTITDNKDELSILIPQGAVSEPVVFQITTLEAGDYWSSGGINQFDFNAYSLQNPTNEIKQFGSDLTVSIHYDNDHLFGLDLNTLALYQIDENTGEMVLVPGSQFDPQTGILSAPINHFNSYIADATPIYYLAQSVPATMVSLQSGSSSASYPIQVPPGSGGFQPLISLEYDSNNVHELKENINYASWVGAGWQLQLGRIIKLRINPHGDYLYQYKLELNNITYDLVEIVPDQEYHTNPETFMRITRSGDTWDVFDKDGTHYKFGSTENSRQWYWNYTKQIDGWYLDTIESANVENEIVITYEPQKNILSDGYTIVNLWPVNISYNDGYSMVVFISSYDRNDVPEEYRIDEDTGTIQVDNRRLEKIETYFDSTKIREYQLSYQVIPQQGDIAAQFLLSSFQEMHIGSDFSIIPFNPTSFTYETFTFDSGRGFSGDITRPFLKTITNPFGGTITYNYETQSCKDWSRIVVSDKQVDANLSDDSETIVTHYQLVANENDPIFKGFYAVFENDLDGNTIQHWYSEYNDICGKETLTQWSEGSAIVKSVASNWMSINLNTSRKPIYFQYQDELSIGEGKSILKYSRIKYSYDNTNGSIKTEYHYGDDSTSSDDYTVFYNYDSTHQMYSQNHILDKPSSERVYSGIVDSDNPALPSLKQDTRFEYDNYGNIIKISEKNGIIFINSIFVHDSHGNVVRSVDPNGNTTYWIYDYFGVLLVSKTSPNIGIESYDYDLGTGNLNSITDVNNQVTSYEYDELHRISKIIEPLDSSISPTIQYIYHYGYGVPVVEQYCTAINKIDDGKFFARNSFFDGLGRNIQVQSTGSAGNTIIDSTTIYNDCGLVSRQYVSQNDSSFNGIYISPGTGWKYTSYTYDALGRVTYQSNYDDTAVSYNYSKPWQTIVNNERGYQKSYSYDSMGQLTQVDDLDESGNPSAPYATTRFEYDITGNLTGVLDAAGNITSMTYDQLGRNTNINDPDSGRQYHGYDDNGNLIYQIDAKGQVINFYYDDLNRLKGKTYLIGVSDPSKYARPVDTGLYTVTYTYDEGLNGKDRLSEVSSPLRSSSIGEDVYNPNAANNSSGISYISTSSSSFSGSGTTDDPYIIQNINDLQNMYLYPDACYRLNNDIDASETSNWNHGAGFVPIPRLPFFYLPNSDGESSLCSLVGSGTMWEAVSTFDDNTSYVKLNQRNAYFQVGVNNIEIPQNMNELILTVGIRVKSQATSYTPTLRVFLIINGIKYYSSNQYLSYPYNNWGDLNVYFQNNPSTGVRWTSNELNSSIQAIGVEATHSISSDYPMLISFIEAVPQTSKIFSGSLDGNGFAISNLHLNWEMFSNIADYDIYVGLFSKLSGSVKNITLNASYVTGWRHLGCIVGLIDRGSVLENCRVIGSLIESTNVYSGLDVGGLAGYIEGAIVERCIVEDSIFKTDDILGGLFGFANNTLISECSCRGLLLEGGSGIGGLIGDFRCGKLTDCQSETDIIYSASGSGNIGGFIGTFSGSSSSSDRSYIKSCSASGQINPSSLSILNSYNGLFIGGFIGSCDVGIIIRDSNSTVNVCGTRQLGGFIGRAYDITAVENCQAFGNVNSPTASKDVGGFVGYYSGSYINNSIINTSFCNGTVSSTNGVSVGGFVGSIDCGTGSGFFNIANCFSRSNVTVSPGGNSTDIGGFAGTIIGYRSEMVNCYSTGLINATQGRVGGFTATTGSPVVRNCFWDIITSGIQTSTFGIGHNTEWMKLKTNFSNAGWDFIKTWYVDLDVNDGYPSISENKIRRSFTYDERGRVLTESLIINGETYSTQYNYNSADQIISITYPTGEIVTQTYNNRGLPKVLYSDYALNLINGMEYNQIDQVKRIQMGNGLETIFDYHGLDSLDSGDSSNSLYGTLYRIKTYNPTDDILIQHQKYWWDASGNLNDRQDVLNSEDEHFTYDVLDRLTEVSGAYSESNVYDPVGNITSRNGISYTYGDFGHKHAVTAYNGTTYAYDINGDIINRGSQILTWDVEKRLISASNGAGFVYDGEDNRILKTENNKTVLYANPYYEKDLSSGVETSYYYLGDNLTAKRSGKDQTYETIYFHQDHLGSTTAMTDNNGALLATQKYTSFGSSRIDPNALPTEKLFTGQRLDATGLYFYNARYYDAGLGRFISPDSIIQDPSDPQNLNKYTYCLNNPLKYTDPSGHFADYFVDWISIAFDIAQFSNQPNWQNAAYLGVDAILSIIPFAPAGVGSTAKAGEGLANGLNKIDAVSSVRGISETSPEVSQFQKGSHQLQKYDVGIYDEIKGVQGLTAHHVGQKALMKQFIPNYNSNKAPAILLPKLGHTLRISGTSILSRSKIGITNARQLLARDIMELRRVYPDIPNSKLRELIEWNKKLYPIMRR